MKKLLFSLIGIIGLSMAANSATITVNGTTNGYYLISTNRASVYSVELTGLNPGVVQLFDCDTIAAPLFGTNYTNLAYIGRSYTNGPIVSSYIGSNGYTNWYTNAGIYSITNTVVANTNPLPVMAAFVVAGGTYAVYNVDALFTRGICATITTNVSMVINYRLAQ